MQIGGSSGTSWPDRNNGKGLTHQQGRKWGPNLEVFLWPLHTHPSPTHEHTYVIYTCTKWKQAPMVILYGELTVMAANKSQSSLTMRSWHLSMCLLPHGKILDELSHLRVWNDAFRYLTNMHKQERKRQNPSQVVSGKMKPRVMMNLHFWALAPPSWGTKGTKWD